MTDTPDEGILDAEGAEVSPTVQQVPSLDRSLLVGIAWTGGVKWATQIVSWVSTIIVARILSPGDFGIMGMATVYVNLISMLNEFGLSTAILQRRELTSQQIAQIGGFGIALGLCFTIVSMLFAGPIAWFYDTEAVRMVIILLSFNFTINAIGVLPRALLMRDLKFHRIAMIDGITSLTQIVVTLGLALSGARYYALVFSSLISSLVGVSLALAARGRRLAMPWPLSNILPSLRVGWHIVVGRFAWYLYQNADFAIVGRFFGNAVLGAYSIGWQIATVPVERISTLIGQVTPGIFSSIQNDRAALRRYFLGIVGGIAFLTFPAAAGIAMTADLLIPTLLGPKWESAVLPLQLLAAYAGIRSIDTVTYQVLVFTGHSRQSMWFNVGIACLLPVLFVVATQWGAAGVAGTWVVAYPFLMIPVYWLLFRILDLTPKAYFANLWPAASSTAIMALVLWLARPPLQAVLPIKTALVAEILCGTLAYSAVLWILHRERLYTFKRIIQTAREK